MNSGAKNLVDARPQLPIPSGLPRVAVVLVNWNGWRDCVECLDSLLVSDYPSFEVVVVDNDSQDRSVEAITAWCAAPTALPNWAELDGVDRLTRRKDAHVRCTVYERPAPLALQQRPGSVPDVHVVRSGGNLGFAGGNNVGMRVAGVDRFDYFWLLNTDTVVDRHALRRLVERALSDPQIGIVGSTLRYYGAPDRIQAAGGAWFNPTNTETRHIGIGDPVSRWLQAGPAAEKQMAYVVGASMFVSSSLVRQVGLMQEDYFLYFEEFDWALRAKPTYTLAYAPASSVFHKVGASSSAVASLASLDLLYRSRLHFLRRFMPAKIGASRRNMLRHALGYARRAKFAHARLLLCLWWESRAPGGAGPRPRG